VSRRLLAFRPPNFELSHNVHIITATNKNLEEAVVRNEFRADLYYRISVVPLMLPPLRERKTDIRLWATEHLDGFEEGFRESTAESSPLEVLARCYFRSSFKFG
jgi:Nif-specific regulatory protein